MIFDYSKLNGRIIEKFGTRRAFAKALDRSERTLSLKLNSKIYFSQGEIMKAVELLNLPKDEIQTYFFKEKVQFIELTT